jgi:hypothetical protein
MKAKLPAWLLMVIFYAPIWLPIGVIALIVWIF